MTCGFALSFGNSFGSALEPERELEICRPRPLLLCTSRFVFVSDPIAGAARGVGVFVCAGLLCGVEDVVRVRVRLGYLSRSDEGSSYFGRYALLCVVVSSGTSAAG